MNTQLLREAIARIYTLDPNDDFGFEKCCKEMTAILTDDIASVKEFFKDECTDEELYWISPVFEDIAERIPSREFIAILRKRLAAVTPENYCQENFQSEHMRTAIDYTEYVRSVKMDIDYADGVTEAMLYNAEAALHEKGGTNDENNDCGNPEGANPHNSGDR